MYYATRELNSDSNGPAENAEICALETMDAVAEFLDVTRDDVLALSFGDCWIASETRLDSDAIYPFTPDQVDTTTSHPGSAKYWSTPNVDVFTA
jgi:hypothetical protein